MDLSPACLFRKPPPQNHRATLADIQASQRLGQHKLKKHQRDLVTNNHGTPRWNSTDLISSQHLQNTRCGWRVLTYATDSGNDEQRDLHHDVRDADVYVYENVLTSTFPAVSFTKENRQEC